MLTRTTKVAAPGTEIVFGSLPSGRVPIGAFGKQQHRMAGEQQTRRTFNFLWLIRSAGTYSGTNLVDRR
jgi:hypothetical protein